MQKRQAIKNGGKLCISTLLFLPFFFARLLFFFRIPVRRLYGDNVNSKRNIFLADNSMVEALKYTHFELKNIVINESKFPRLV